MTMTNRHRLLLLWFAGIVSHLYCWTVAAPTFGAVGIVLTGIANGTYCAPFRYRVLVPALGNVLTAWMPQEAALVLGSTLLTYAAFAGMALTAFELFRRLYGEQRATVGGLAVLALPIMPFHNLAWYGSTPDTWLETAFFLGGAALLYDWFIDGKPRPLHYGALVFVAATNRATGGLLVGMFAAAVWFHGRNAHNWRWLVVYGALWVGVVVGLRVIIGPEPGPVCFTVAGIAEANRTGWRLRYTVEQLALMGGPLLVLAVAGWRRVPPFVRSLTPVFAAYVLPVLVFGIWSETRLFVPVLAWAVGVALAGLGDE